MTQALGPALGTDFLCDIVDDSKIGEMDVTWDLAENDDGRSVYLRAIFLRLICPRGGLWYSPTYGLGIAKYLLGTATNAQIQQEVSAECMKDERTANAAVTVQREQRRGGDRITITVQLTTTFGQVYPMTIGIDAVTGVQLLTQQAA